jgi:hypothetical protein
VLGGILLLHYSSTLSGCVTRRNENEYATTRVNIALGPAIRYAFTLRWEVAANALVNYYPTSIVTSSFSDHLLLNALVGVQIT